VGFFQILHILHRMGQR